MFPSPISDIWRMLPAVVLLALLGIGVATVLAPFFSALLWGLILCLATWPAFLWVKRRLGGRATLAAAIMTLVPAIGLVVPLVVLATSVVSNVETVRRLAESTLANGWAAMPDWLSRVPVIGNELVFWHIENFGSREAVRETFQAIAGPAGEAVLAVTTAIAAGLFELSLGIIIAFFFFRHGDRISPRIIEFFNRFVGERGTRLLNTAEQTIIGVIYGVLGAAVAQGTVAGIGFAIAGIPGAVLLGMATFVLSFFPMGPPLVWVPVAIWLFSEGEIGWGLFMTLWGLMVSSVDNFIRPYFISVGTRLPLLLVLLGAFGGIIAFGFIGLFIGPVVLAVAWTLAIEWSAPEEKPALEGAEEGVAGAAEQPDHPK